tara:strand:- start:13214 stop:14464 length:1251 start_codon:yes stop_codon:yes gene_type:complete
MMIKRKIYNYIFRIFFLIKLIIKALIKIPLNVFYLFIIFLPRNSNIWSIGAWEGEHFRGSCKYFYKYIKNEKKINIFWITKNKNLFIENNKYDKNFLYAYSLKAIFILMRSKIIIFSHGLYDFLPYFTNGSKLIMINHVTFPIKDMSFYRMYNKYNLTWKIINYINSPYDHIKPDFEITSSNNVKNGIFLNENNSKDNKRILGLGLPKTDYLVNKINEKNDKHATFKTYFSDYNFESKIILFLPTWRGDKKFSIFNNGFDNEKINKFLINNNIYLIINFHPFDETKRLKDKINLGARIKTLTLDGEQINDLLYLSDIFMTDYSSLFSDYLLFDKEIIFTKFDHSKYTNERNLLFNYEDLPGSIINNWLDFEISVFKIFGNKNLFKQKRLDFKKKIYSDNDNGKNCYNIYNFLLHLK